MKQLPVYIRKLFNIELSRNHLFSHKIDKGGGFLLRRKYRRPRKKGNIKAFIAIIGIFLFLIYSFLLVDQKVKPSVLAIAEVNPRATLSPHLGQVYVIGLMSSVSRKRAIAKKRRIPTPCSG